jgi:vancomycin resistance protein YoaR
MVLHKTRNTVLALIIILVTGISAFLLYYQMYFFLPGVFIASYQVEGMNKAQACEVVAKAAERLYTTPITFSFEDYNYTTCFGAVCQPINVEKTVEDIWAEEKKKNWRNRLFSLTLAEKVVYPLPLTFDQTAINHLQEKWNQDLALEPVNARLEVDEKMGLVIIPGSPGREVNLEKTLGDLNIDWEGLSPVNAQIAMKERTPSVSVADLENIGELSSYYTWYNTEDIDRSHNLKMAASLINNMVIKPGSEFSFNQVVGPRTYELGYRDALIINGGKFEPGLGGGICQVSSTLYNACLLAGLEITERHNHALAVAYVPVGLDATVAYRLQDFRFVNNTDSPIYIHSMADRGKLSISIYGNLEFKKPIKVFSVIDKVIEYQDVKEINPNLPPGEEKIEHAGQNGFVARSFRSFLDENGELLYQEFLAKDTYQPLNRLIYTGPDIDNGEGNQDQGDSNKQENQGEEQKTNTDDNDHQGMINPRQPGDPEKEEGSPGQDEKDPGESNILL